MGSKGKYVFGLKTSCITENIVMANGMMSEEQDVVSGVPQGTVLASILFIIMISDIDENLKSSIVGLFADDTRMSAKIRSKEDEELLQHDLEAVYAWADENLMEFNESQVRKNESWYNRRRRRGNIQNWIRKSN